MIDYKQQVGDLTALAGQENHDGEAWDTVQEAAFMLEALGKERDELKQQRDELLDALKDINEKSPNLGGLDNPTEFALSDARGWCISDMKSIARKAIAKAGEA